MPCFLFFLGKRDCTYKHWPWSPMPMKKVPWKFTRWLFSQLDNQSTKSEAVMIMAAYAAKDVYWPIHALTRGRFVRHLDESWAPNAICGLFPYAWGIWIRHQHYEEKKAGLVIEVIEVVEVEYKEVMMKTKKRKARVYVDTTTPRELAAYIRKQVAEGRYCYLADSASSEVEKLGKMVYTG